MIRGVVPRPAAMWAPNSKLEVVQGGGKEKRR
jgi:hypothetical protein